MADLVMPACADNTTWPAEPSDLEVAISVAQQLLDSDQILSVREALRLLLRAKLTAEEKGYASVRTPGGEQKRLASPAEARELRELLAAIREALALPYSANGYDRRLLARTGWAQTVLAAVLDDPGEDIGWNADFLRAKLAAEQADAERRERGASQ